MTSSNDLRRDPASADRKRMAYSALVLVRPTEVAPSALEQLRQAAEAAEASAEASLADATRNSYASDWEHFQRWCSGAMMILGFILIVVYYPEASWISC